MYGFFTYIGVLSMVFGKEYSLPGVSWYLDQASGCHTLLAKGMHKACPSPDGRSATRAAAEG